MRQTQKTVTINERTIVVNQIKALNNFPTILWLGGYLSDMSGSKATFLRNWALEADYGCVCFDFSYTGLSQNVTDEKLESDNPSALIVPKEFLQASLGEWLEEALYIYEKFCNDNTIIVSSSCGGWIALLLAQLLHEKNYSIKSLILLAPAPDFTKDLLNEEELLCLEKQDYVYIQEENVALPFSKKFIEDAKKHYILDKKLNIEQSVYILQGSLDKIVSKEHSLKVMNILPYSDVSFTLLKDANHSLSREQDLNKLINIITL